MLPSHTIKKSHKKQNTDLSVDNYRTVITFKIASYAHGSQQNK